MPGADFSDGLDDGSDGNGSSAEDTRVGPIVEFWREACISEYYGATTRGELEELERQVTGALFGPEPDIELAEAYTARALFLITGQIQ